jgi:ABC-type phosphate/phosphonate transport system permease subunit
MTYVIVAAGTALALFLALPASVFLRRRHAPGRGG